MSINVKKHILAIGAASAAIVASGYLLTSDNKKEEDLQETVKKNDSGIIDWKEEDTRPDKPEVATEDESLMDKIKEKILGEDEEAKEKSDINGFIEKVKERVAGDDTKDEDKSGLCEFVDKVKEKVIGEDKDDSEDAEEKNSFNTGIIDWKKEDTRSDDSEKDKDENTSV